MQINKWVTLIFGAICLMAVASAMGAQDLYYMAAILLTLPGVSYFFGWYALRGLIFERNSPPLLWAGEQAEIVCTIRNPSRAPRYFLSLQDSLPRGAERAEDAPLFNLGAGESSRIAQWVRFPRRGVFTSVAFEATALDPLGIFSFSKKIPGEDEWVVYPTPLVLTDVAAVGSERYGWQSVVRAAQRGGSIEPDGARRYVAGDPLRRIHWRQTARTNALSVIEFEESVALNLMIALDCSKSSVLSAGADDTLEIAVRAAVSLAQAALAQGASVSLLAEGALAVNEPESEQDYSLLPPGRGEAYLYPILNALARVEVRGDVPLREILLARTNEILPGTTLLALTSNPDPALAETMAAFGIRGVSSFVIYVEPPLSDAGRKERSPFRRDNMIAALLAHGAQAAILRLGSEGEACLETLENAA